jgi:ElaB/YqjD/DUF883 family membrane-anchored ribosome-binding protein
MGTAVDVGGLSPTFPFNNNHQGRHDMADTPPAKAPRKRATPNVAVKEPVVETKTTVEKLKEEASTLAGEATQAARNAATQGKDKAAEALTGLSKIANDAAGTVDQHLGKTYGDYARKASVGVEKAATKLQEKDVDQLVGEATEFVKKRPAIVAGAVAAIGLVLVGLFSGRNKNDKA